MYKTIFSTLIALSAMMSLSSCAPRRTAYVTETYISSPPAVVVEESYVCYHRPYPTEIIIIERPWYERRHIVFPRRYVEPMGYSSRFSYDRSECRRRSGVHFGFGFGFGRSW